MTKEAEAHAEEDRRKRHVVDLKNQADQQIYATEKMLKEHGEKVPGSTRGKIETAINNLKEAIKGDDGDAISRAMENLNSASQDVGKTLYEEAAKRQASSPPPPSGGQAGPSSGDEGRVHRKNGGDDVIDAEFEAK